MKKVLLCCFFIISRTTCLPCSLIQQHGCELDLPTKQSPVVTIDARECLFGGLGNTVELIASIHEIVLRAKKRLQWFVSDSIEWENFFVYENGLIWNIMQDDLTYDRLITNAELIQENMGAFASYTASFKFSTGDDRKHMSDKLLAGFWNTIFKYGEQHVLVRVKDESCHLFNMPSVEKKDEIIPLIFQPTFTCPKRCHTSRVLYFRTFAADSAVRTQKFSMSETLRMMSLQSRIPADKIREDIARLCTNHRISVVSDSWKFKRLVKTLCGANACSKFMSTDPVVLSKPEATELKNNNSKTLEVLCDLFTLKDAYHIHVVYAQSFLGAIDWFKKQNDRTAHIERVWDFWEPIITSAELTPTNQVSEFPACVHANLTNNECSTLFVNAYS